MTRTAFSVSRDLDLATQDGLVKRMGIIREGWLRASVKELIDNSLDACEEHGVDPEITVTIAGSVLTVADNGPGMPPEIIERLCTLAECTSSRAAYAAPDRGAQGNALQTIMMLGFGFGRETSRLTIESRGINHQIGLRVNRLAGQIELERVATEVQGGEGTSVSIVWPEPIDRGHIEHLVDEHAWLNPHVEYRLIIGASSCSWEATAAICKWTPGLPIPAHWYTLERFAHRVLLEIGRDRQITVAQFLGTFAGLKSTVKRAEVAAAVELSYQPLATLLDSTGTRVDQASSEALLWAMQQACRAPKPDVLGSVGRETFEGWACNLDHGEPQLLTYNTFDTVVHGTVPIRWEIGFCHLPGASGRALLVGQNFSPALLPAHMANMVLNGDWHFSEPEHIGLLLHRITPARHTVDFGKTIPAIYQDEVAFVTAALKKLGAGWIKYRDRQLRGKRPALPSAPKPERMTIKDLVARYLPAAYRIASSNGAYPTSPRQIYYRLRPKILKLTGKDEFGYGYFVSDLLPHYEQDNPEVTVGWRIFRKARGALREPHTARVIPLGTAEVAGYRGRWTNGEAPIGFAMPGWFPDTIGPHNRYGGLVIVEKDGIAELLILAGVGERFDVAIVGNEGQSVEAELRLADALGLPVFVLHDFDRTGLTICENLREGTWRYRYRNAIEVIEIGLRLDQVADLESEPINKANLESVGEDRLRECGATEAEITFLGPHDDPKAPYGRRVELNAMITADLVEMVEAALTGHGIEKIVPKACDLGAAWRSAKAPCRDRRCRC
jgi:hypothetical protein